MNKRLYRIKRGRSLFVEAGTCHQNFPNLLKFLGFCIFHQFFAPREIPRLRAYNCAKGVRRCSVVLVFGVAFVHQYIYLHVDTIKD